MVSRRNLLTSALVGGSAYTLGMDGVTGSELDLTWRMVSTYPSGSVDSKNMNNIFVPMISQLTNHKFQIDYYDAGELVPPFGVFDAVKDGEVELGHTASYYYYERNEALALDSIIPFGMNFRQFQAWWHHGDGKALLKGLFQKYNLVTFPMTNTGAQMGGFWRQEINSLADIQGLRFRLAGMGATIIERIGVTPKKIPPGEIYEQLKTGQIDGAEFVGPTADMILNLHNAANYYYTPGWWEPGCNVSLYINRDKFIMLPPAYQRALEIAASYLNTYQLAEYDAANSNSLKILLNEGIEIREFPDDILEAAYEAAQEYYAELSERNEDFRTIFSNYSQFLVDQGLWSGVAEERYRTFMRSLI